MEFFSATLPHEEPPPSSDIQGSIPEESPIWSRLWNSDNSRSLKFQWTNCFGAKDLFSALNVDSRNIVSFSCAICLWSYSIAFTDIS